jgi:hypothetical protein
MASERRPATYEAGPKQTEFLFDLALQLLNAVGIDSPAASSLLKNLGLVEPFSRYPEKIESLKEKLAQCLPKM